MEEPLTHPAEETAWYENEQPIQEFLHSYKKPEKTNEDILVERPSWLEITKKTKKN